MWTPLGEEYSACCSIQVTQDNLLVLRSTDSQHSLFEKYLLSGCVRSWLWQAGSLWHRLSSCSMQTQLLLGRVGSQFLDQDRTCITCIARWFLNLPAMQETRVQSLGGKDPLTKGMATHSNIPAQRIPWTEELVDYSPWGRQESTRLSKLAHCLYSPHCMFHIHDSVILQLFVF